MVDWLFHTCHRQILRVGRSRERTRHLQEDCGDRQSWLGSRKMVDAKLMYQHDKRDGKNTAHFAQMDCKEGESDCPVRKDVEVIVHTLRWV